MIQGEKRKNEKPIRYVELDGCDVADADGGGKDSPHAAMELCGPGWRAWMDSQAAWSMIRCFRRVTLIYPNFPLIRRPVAGDR